MLMAVTRWFGFAVLPVLLSSELLTISRAGPHTSDLLLIIRHIYLFDTDDDIRVIS